MRGRVSEWREEEGLCWYRSGKATHPGCLFSVSFGFIYVFCLFLLFPCFLGVRSLKNDAGEEYSENSYTGMGDFTGIFCTPSVLVSGTSEYLFFGKLFSSLNRIQETEIFQKKIKNSCGEFSVSWRKWFRYVLSCCSDTTLSPPVDPKKKKSPLGACAPDTSPFHLSPSPHGCLSRAVGPTPTWPRQRVRWDFIKRHSIISAELQLRASTRKSRPRRASGPSAGPFSLLVHAEFTSLPLAPPRPRRLSHGRWAIW